VRGYDVVTASDGRSAWRTMQGGDPPRLLLLDWVMSGMSGVELCKKLKQAELEKPIYIIIVTAMSKEKDLLKGFEAGADDYITKPYNANELQARIGVGMKMLSAQDSLIYTANHDYLTGALNRRAVIDALHRELARAGREKKALTTAILDIDRFKNINDTYGHMVGDEVLKGLVRKLQSIARPYDYIGRLGGEEFLLVLPGLESVDSGRRLEAVRQEVEDCSITTDGGDVGLTISIGAVVAEGDADVDKIIGSADRALYRAKDEGRNRVAFAREKGEAITRTR